MSAGGYRDPSEHLRDELWRVWLRVEHEIRNQWETGRLLVAADESRVGALGPHQLDRLFASARAEHVDAQPLEGTSAAQLLQAFVQQSRTIEARLRATPAPLPLPTLAQRFGLTPRQHATLVFALMPELDPHLLNAYRYLSNDQSCRGLDARLLAWLVYDTPESRPHLSRDLSPASPLVRFRLLELDDFGPVHDSLLFRRVRGAARLVQMLSGAADALDPEVSHLAQLRSGDGEDGPLDEPLLRRAREALGAGGVALVVQGVRGVGKRRLLARAAHARGQRLLLVDTRALTSQPLEAQQLALRRLWREAILLDAVLAFAGIDEAATPSGDGNQLPPSLVELLAELDRPVALTLCRDRLPELGRQSIVHLQLPIPGYAQRQQLWQRHAAGLAPADARTLAERFAVPSGAIARAAAAARAAGGSDVAALDQALRAQLHDRLARLGQPLATPHELTDLVVDDDTLSTLCEIVACVRERRQVRDVWGFRGPPGVSVLFSGGPGVGKTMSATVLARQLGLTVYEIDLSRVMSKWIGETEKNLAEVFDAAEPGHVVLLFNEADSLFGKRTAEVSSSNDRYANLQTNYLLQRLERFGGLAILTSNFSKAIDPAFRRRLAYDVSFTFPSPEMRAKLWQKAIPAKALGGRVAFAELAQQYELSGGYIKVAAERAAYVAASLGESITQETLVLAIERMYRERGKMVARGVLE